MTKSMKPKMVVHLVGRRFAQWSLELQYCPCCEAGGWLAMQYKGIYSIFFSQSQSPHSSLRGYLEGTTSVKMQKNDTNSDWMYFFLHKGHLIALLIKNRNVWMGMYLSWKSVCLACPGFHTQHQFKKKKPTYLFVYNPNILKKEVGVGSSRS